MFGENCCLLRGLVQRCWCEARRLLADLQPDTAEYVTGVTREDKVVGVYVDPADEYKTCPDVGD